MLHRKGPGSRKTAEWVKGADCCASSPGFESSEDSETCVMDRKKPCRLSSGMTSPPTHINSVIKSFLIKGQEEMTSSRDLAHILSSILLGIQ